MNKNGQNLIMADLLSFAIGMWTIVFTFLKMKADFLRLLNSQHSNLELRERADKTTAVFGYSK